MGAPWRSSRGAPLSLLSGPWPWCAPASCRAGCVQGLLCVQSVPCAFCRVLCPAWADGGARPVQSGWVSARVMTIDLTWRRVLVLPGPCGQIIRGLARTCNLSLSLSPPLNQAEILTSPTICWYAGLRWCLCGAYQQVQPVGCIHLAGKACQWPPASSRGTCKLAFLRRLV
jgi:hypothetical protein